jgi:hypothetical protein
MERSIEFSFTDKKEFKVTFALQVKAHLPVFKEETSLFAGNTMEGFQSNTYLPPLIFGPSGGGADTLLGNQGNPGPIGSTQEGTNGNTFGPTAANPPSGPVDNNDSTWPLNPSTEFPPEGGTGY